MCLTSKPSDQIQLRGLLRWARDLLPYHALMDSMADDKFSDQNFVVLTNILTLPLTEPEEVLAIDGKFFVQVTHMTVLLTLTSLW